MINTAPENLDREKGAGGAPEGAKEYVPWKINIKEEQEDTTQIDNEIENAEEWNQWWNENKKVLHEAEHTTQQKIPDWFDKQAEEFATKHPELKNRIPAAKEITNDLNDPKEKNNIFGKISKRLLWPQNI